MPRSILASLTGLGTDRAVIEAAVAAAHIEGGHVTCLHARIDAIETAAMVEVMFPQQRDGLAVVHQITQEQSEREHHAREAFDAAVKRHGLALRNKPGGEGEITASWHQTTAFFRETLEEARFHELVVMAKDQELPMERIKTVLMQSGRPLLLAPPKSLPKIGHKVAIAWKEGAEAARAVTAASSILSRAEEVVVLCVSRNPAGDDRDRLSTERLAKSLRWRGVKVEVQMEYAAASPEAAALKNMAYNRDADLLVMGAYGHGRFREFVLGGVTEEMLNGCGIPVLMFR
jgi:nucleotide-binding universal stress UspA family protein